MAQIKVFVSYSHQDNKWRKKLASYLAVFEEAGLVSVWHDIKIPPGTEWKKEIEDQLNNSELILLLVSNDFLESRNCKREMDIALELYGSGKACVVPIIIGHSEWKKGALSKLNALPTYGDPVSTLPDENEAFLDIATRLASNIKDLTVPEQSGPWKKPSIKNIFRFNRDYCLSIGVDVGATKIDCALVKLNNKKKLECEVCEIARIEHDDLKNESKVLRNIYQIVDEVIQKEKINRGQIDAIGLGLPGMVNRDDGQLCYAPGLQIESYNFCSLLNEEYNVPVQADNDVNCSTLAELAVGHGKSYRNFVCVFIRTGIGAGVVVDSRIVRGHKFSAGEVGHMKIDFLPDARKCNCGQKGCYEEYASARAMVRLARVKIFDIIERQIDSELIRLDPTKITPQDIVSLVKDGDDEAKDLANEIAGYLSIGLANIANLLNPEAIILGGGTIEGFLDIDDFHVAMKNEFENYTIKTVNMTSLLQSSFKSTDSVNPAPLIGAALLPFEKAFTD